MAQWFITYIFEEAISLMFLFYIGNLIWEYRKIKKNIPDGEILLEMFLKIEYNKFRRRKKYI